jgi:hypothetical protein
MGGFDQLQKIGGRLRAEAVTRSSWKSSWRKRNERQRARLSELARHRQKQKLDHDGESLAHRRQRKIEVRHKSGWWFLLPRVAHTWVWRPRLWTAKPKLGTRPNSWPESGNETENRLVNSELRRADPKCEKRAGLTPASRQWMKTRSKMACTQSRGKITQI